MIVGWWLVRGLYYPIYWGWSEPMEIPTNQAVQRNSRWFCTVLIWATKDNSIEWLINRGQYPWAISGGLTIQISENLGFNQRIIWDLVTRTGCKTMVVYRGFNHQNCGFKHPNFRKMDLTCIWKGENSAFTSKIGNVTWFNYPDMGVFNLKWNMSDGCWGSIAYIKRLLVWWLSGTSRWEPCVMFAEVSPFQNGRKNQRNIGYEADMVMITAAIALFQTVTCMYCKSEVVCCFHLVFWVHLKTCS